jgi:hypothetical protein
MFMGSVGRGQRAGNIQPVIGSRVLDLAKEASAGLLPLQSPQ